MRNKSDSENGDACKDQTREGASKKKDPPTTAQDDDDDERERARIERMKLKKRQKKQRQREKKAKAAAEAASRQREQSDEDVRAKQRREGERKREQQIKGATGGFKTLARGVKCLDLVVGTGPPAQHRKKVRVSYTLRSKSHATGRVLDSSSNFPFRLGRGEVIPGWDIGLRDMRVGGTRRLVVPPEAGYGRHRDVGAGRGGDLYFQIELLHVAP